MDLDDPDLNSAAVRIQAAQRGKSGRKEFQAKQAVQPSASTEESIDLDDPDLNSAAVKIQSVQRGKSGRKEFQEKHAVSRLIGSPPGYVGHEEGGNLTEKIRHRPYSVVLFDEVEKAHPEVFNILLQVLDNGHLTDAKGRKVNFKNTVVILTSNIGARYIDKMQKLGFGTGEVAEDYKETKAKVTESLKEYFRPEFLNRLDDIVIFDILSKKAIEEIVKIQIGFVKERLSQKEINLKLSAKALKHLAEKGYDPQYGARPLKRLIQSKIMTQVANLMISKGIMKGGSISVDVKGGKFVFDVKKGRKGSLMRKELIEEKRQ